MLRGHRISEVMVINLAVLLGYALTAGLYIYLGLSTGCGFSEGGKFVCEPYED
jgi:hypothetical protein